MPTTRAQLTKAPLALALTACLGACQTATGPGDPTTPARDVVAPACSSPAPLKGQYDPRARGYIVVFREGTDAATETARLGEKYGFRAGSVWTAALQGFYADLSVATVAGIRCEATVRYVEYNATVTASGA